MFIKNGGLFFMKIIILDGYTANPGDLSWDGLKKFGDLTVYDRTMQCDIQKRIADSEIVFTNKTPITKETMDACRNLKFIGVLATGYNIVDTAAAAQKNITVCNVPAYSTEATAQFAIAMLLEICHGIGHMNGLVHSGEWQRRGDFCFWDTRLTELSGKTLGIIGLGSIGSRTAAIAGALGMNVVAVTSGSRKHSETENFRYACLDELLAVSDVIALHCPLTEKTKEIINKETISKMKNGVILINNARGGLLNEKDVADALFSGKIRAAALDVLSEEPPDKSNPLLSAPNCIITPHISWAPFEARKRLIDASVHNLEMFLAGKTVNKVL
jgi:glycerate dehydrogenase